MTRERQKQMRREAIDNADQERERASMERVRSRPKSSRSQQYFAACISLILILVVLGWISDAEVDRGGGQGSSDTSTRRLVQIIDGQIWPHDEDETSDPDGEIELAGSFEPIIAGWPPATVIGRRVTWELLLSGSDSNPRPSGTVDISEQGEQLDALLASMVESMVFRHDSHPELMAGAVTARHQVVADYFPWSIVLFYMYLLAALFWSAASVVWLLRVYRRIRRRSFGPGDCPACGYNLKGTREHRCPECGLGFSEDRSESGPARESRHAEAYASKSRQQG